MKEKGDSLVQNALSRKVLIRHSHAGGNPGCPYISRRQALKDLSELVEKDLLIKEGKGRAVRYLLTQKS